MLAAALLACNRQAHGGDPAGRRRALRYLEASVAGLRAANDRPRLLTALHNWGRFHPEAEAGRDLLIACRDLSRELGDVAREAEAIRGLAYRDLVAGDDRTARHWLDGALALSQEHGDRQGISDCRFTSGMLALSLGQWVIAAQLCGAAGAVWRAGGMPRLWYQHLYESRMRSLRTELFEQKPENWREDMALPVERAIVIAA